MRRLALALLILAILAPVARADATMFELKVRYPDGEPVSGLSVALYVGDVAKPAATNVDGIARWWLNPGQSQTKLALTGYVLSVTSTGEVDTWPEGGYVYVEWDAGAPDVLVDVTLSDQMPTATPTRTATGTPWPTETPGPSPTPLATWVPDPRLPYMILEAKPEVQPQRFTYTWWANKVDVDVMSADGESFGTHPDENSYEGSGWVRFYVQPDPALFPPTVVTREVTVIATMVCPTPAPTLTIGEMQREVLRRIWRGLFP